uniref:Serine-threonine/tyrosine-protein kinase catalytic domain-containing protein n=1 Tax=Acrobeloides nanus TaxID=290746 RepID=A0A914DLB3_9BILA
MTSSSFTHGILILISSWLSCHAWAYSTRGRAGFGEEEWLFSAAHRRAVDWHGTERHHFRHVGRETIRYQALRYSPRQDRPSPRKSYTTIPKLVYAYVKGKIPLDGLGVVTISKSNANGGSTHSQCNVQGNSERKQAIIKQNHMENLSKVQEVMAEARSFVEHSIRTSSSSMESRSSTMTNFIFDFATEIWSFGIISWEIYSGGQESYSGLIVCDVNEQIAILEL